jgi:hypothetical protein
MDPVKSQARPRIRVIVPMVTIKELALNRVTKTPVISPKQVQHARLINRAGRRGTSSFIRYPIITPEKQ